MDTDIDLEIFRYRYTQAFPKNDKPLLFWWRWLFSPRTPRCIHTGATPVSLLILISHHGGLEQTSLVYKRGDKDHTHFSQMTTLSAFGWIVHRSKQHFQFIKWIRRRCLPERSAPPGCCPWGDDAEPSDCIWLLIFGLRWGSGLEGASKCSSSSSSFEICNLFFRKRRLTSHHCNMFHPEIFRW